MRNMINKILLTILPILLVALFLDRCSLSKKYNTATEQISKLELDNQKLTSITNRQDEIILTQNTIITENKEALDNLTDSIFDLKKKDEKNTRTIAYYKAITKARIDSVGVPYMDTIAMKEWEDSVKKECQQVIDYYELNTISVPRDAYDSTDNYTISATVKKDSLMINSLSIPDTLQLRFVEKKGGLFKRKSVEVQFFHSNPLIQTTQANSVIYRPRKKSLWQKVLPVAVGIGVGILISK